MRSDTYKLIWNLLFLSPLSWISLLIVYVLIDRCHVSNRSCNTEAVILLRSKMAINAGPIVISLLLVVAGRIDHFLFRIYPPVLLFIVLVFFRLFCLIEYSLQAINQIFMVFITFKNIEAWKHKFIFFLNKFI